ncbi:MAG: 2Fe-2S ferredoxin [Rhodospirillaceae bacterium]|nr:2Fe-2S ferredoxin [Rhodospirillaceae bacterium]
MPRLIMTSTDGETKTFNVNVGLTVMEIGRDELMGIEGICGGCLSCATCHVIVDPDWFERTGKISDDEDEMLDMAAERTPTSRLGCQVKMTDDLDGLTVTVPDEI